LYKKYEQIFLVIKELKTDDKIIFGIKHLDKKLSYDEYSDDFLDKDVIETNEDTIANSFIFSPIFNLVNKGITNKLLGRKREYFDYDIYKKKRVKQKYYIDENNINKKNKILKVVKKYPNDISTIPILDDTNEDEIIDLNNQNDESEGEKFISLEEASKYIDIEVETGLEKEKEKFQEKQKERIKGSNLFNVHKEERKEIIENKNKKGDYTLTPEEIKNLFQKRHPKYNKYHKLNKYHLERNDLFKSKIIKNESEMNLILSGIKLVNKDTNSENMKTISLIYNSKKDGTSSSSFHQKCDYKKDILILIRTRNHAIFGGYTKSFFESLY